MKAFKISANYWHSLKPFEQEYVRQRVEKETIPSIKLTISQARKQYPNYCKIYGNGFIEMPTGETYLFSGPDTRKFYKL